ncbi:MAG: enoyl-CoA hydratase/isomerase family protein [Acidobacteria bacterium]|nr:enoyl-CoA hydratase/isomerase family protein [Acidobacteriota bacterium]
MAERQPVLPQFRTISVERAVAVATVVLNKPPLNIIDMEMMAEMQAALDDLERQPDVRVLVFRASGKAFSAGVSIRDHTPHKIGQMIPLFHGIFRRLARTDKVTLAVVHGVCLGGGFELVSMCDLVVAAHDAQFGQPEIKLGQLPPVGIILLPYLIGYRKAAELVLGGGNIGAREAQALGLVNRVAPEGQLANCVDNFVHELSSGSGSTLRLTKKSLRRVSGLDFERALEESEQFFLNDVVNTEDAKEGVFAFLEKRAPRWTNR